MEFDSNIYIKKLLNQYQEGPHIGNPFLEDEDLQYAFNIFFKDNQKIFGDLEKFGDLITEKCVLLAREAEEHQPTHTPYTAWGQRTDNIETTPAWKKLKIIAAENGVINDGYCVDSAGHHRIFQFFKIYMFCPSSGLVSCPLAMTDGAAYITRLLAQKNHLFSKKLKNVHEHLISKNPSIAWTSGQWMTERMGGSDVTGATSTLAIPSEKPGRYYLHGIKWFTSAIDADVALTLARIVEKGKPHSKLSAFLVKVRKRNGELNNMKVVRLKDKLGTRQLPTAELILEGSKAYLISDIEQGIKLIADMLNITRIYNSITAISKMRRIITLVRDYSTRRKAFGKLISEHKLYAKTLAVMTTIFKGNFYFVLKMTEIFGKIEAGCASLEESACFRLLLPVMKLYTAKDSVAIISEGLECFGGLGYMEDSGLPCLLRDAQVLPIWEGTTNVLSLDLYRGIKVLGVTGVQHFWKYIQEMNSKIISVLEFKNDDKASFLKVLEIGHFIKNIMYQILKKEQLEESHELLMRSIAFALGHFICANLLLEKMTVSGDEIDEFIFMQWYNLRIVGLITQLKNEEKLLSLEQIKSVSQGISNVKKIPEAGNIDSRNKARPRL